MPLRSSYAYLYNSRPLEPPDSHRRRRWTGPSSSSSGSATTRSVPGRRGSPADILSDMGTAGPDLDLAVEVQQWPPRSGVFPNILGNLQIRRSSQGLEFSHETTVVFRFFTWKKQLEKLLLFEGPNFQRCKPWVLEAAKAEGNLCDPQHCRPRSFDMHRRAK